MVNTVLDAKTLMERAVADARQAEKIKEDAVAELSAQVHQVQSYQVENEQMEKVISDLRSKIALQLERDADRMARLERYERMERDMNRLLGVKEEADITVDATMHSLNQALAELDAKTQEALRYQVRLG